MYWPSATVVINKMLEAITYQIRIKGTLDKKWSSYFAPFTVSNQEGETLLIGVAHDQAELFGILLKIRDSGLDLVAVNPV